MIIKQYAVRDILTILECTLGSVLRRGVYIRRNNIPNYYILKNVPNEFSPTCIYFGNIAQPTVNSNQSAKIDLLSTKYAFPFKSGAGIHMLQRDRPSLRRYRICPTVC